MSKDHDFIVPFDKAEKIIDSPQQMHKIMMDGEWTGETINKAHVVATRRDYEAEREHASERSMKIEPPSSSNPKIIQKFVKETGEKLKKDGII